MSEEEPFSDIVLRKSPEVSELLEERNINDDDVKQVIYNAEQTGCKLFQKDSNRLLAKLSLPNAVFYVEYEIDNEEYLVHSSYFHRSQFI